MIYEYSWLHNVLLFTNCMPDGNLWCTLCSVLVYYGCFLNVFFFLFPLLLSSLFPLPPFSPFCHSNHDYGVKCRKKERFYFKWAEMNFAVTCYIYLLLLSSNAYAGEKMTFLSFHLQCEAIISRIRNGKHLFLFRWILMWQGSIWYY